jgi:hypothetical protein
MHGAAMVDLTSARMVSGFGAFHSNEPSAKIRTPYVTITWPDVPALVGWL